MTTKYKKTPKLKVIPFFVPAFAQFKKKIQIKSFDALIVDQNGQKHFEKLKIKAPIGWSQTAVDIAASKYFRRTVKKENSIFMLVERISSGLRTAILNSQILKSQNEINDFLEEIQYHLLNQSAAFNSPVWFNCGLSESYGLKSKSHHFALDFKTKKIVEVTDAYKRPQCSACFIQSVDDSLESIFDLIKTEAKLFRYGSGSGTNFSTLRSKFELLQTGGTSSGLIAFLEILDKSAGVIKSGGTTRRAAKMVCVDIDHPEILEFINWKMKEEKKALTLIAGGYSADLDGDAYHTISGQNANNSVRISDQFMKAYLGKKDWALKARTNRKTIQTISAQKIWDELCLAAWTCADPGVQFDSTIQKFHTCANTDRIRASNPCSEYMFLDNSACNLASINLVNFFDKNDFKMNEFLHTVKTFILAQESLVDYASYPTQEIAQNSHDYRPLGLGFANLGSVIMRMGLSYDSDEARAWAGFIAALMTGMAYYTSAEMAEQVGPFNKFKMNQKPMLNVISRHRKALKNIQWDYLPLEFKEISFDLWDAVIKMGNKNGFRNSQVTVIAPTGTIGLVMDCDTTGIEPEYSLVKYKKLSGGGQLKMVNQSVVQVLRRFGYMESQIDRVCQLIENREDFLSIIRPEHHKIFYTAAGSMDSGKDILTPDAHLLMMAAVQPFISGAISKTVNMPSTATQADVSDVYLKAWQLGLKAVAIYRDGSKFVQPLNQKKQSKFPACTVCGGDTQLESGCFKCLNCGTTTACSS